MKHKNLLVRMVEKEDTGLPYKPVLGVEVVTDKGEVLDTFKVNDCTEYRSSEEVIIILKKQMGAIRGSNKSKKQRSTLIKRKEKEIAANPSGHVRRMGYFIQIPKTRNSTDSISLKTHCRKTLKRIALRVHLGIYRVDGDRLERTKAA